MYSTYDQGKSVITERFIRTLKNKVYKYMTTVSKNVYIDKLYEIVNKYNKIYYSTIKMNLLMKNQVHILTLVKNLLILLEYQI